MLHSRRGILSCRGERGKPNETPRGVRSRSKRSRARHHDWLRCRIIRQSPKRNVRNDRGIRCLIQRLGAGDRLASDMGAWTFFSVNNGYYGRQCFRYPISCLRLQRRSPSLPIARYSCRDGLSLFRLPSTFVHRATRATAAITPILRCLDGPPKPVPPAAERRQGWDFGGSR